MRKKRKPGQMMPAMYPVTPPLRKLTLQGNFFSGCRSWRSSDGVPKFRGDEIKDLGNDDENPLAS